MNRTKVLDRQFFPAGALVIEQGTVGNRAFMVESGVVEVFVKDGNGKELILSRLGPGALVGEMAVMSDGFRSASVRTREDCILVAISASEMHASLRSSENLYKRIMRMVVERVKDTNVKLIEKERELAELEKLSRQNLEEVAAHLAARQTRLKEELIPAINK